MLLDTYAWVEFFRETEKGKKVKELLKNNACFTCAVSIAELSEWVAKDNLNRPQIIGSVKKLSVIINVDEDLCAFAGEANAKLKKEIKGWGMMDSIIYATAKIYGMQVITGDQHFKSLPDAIMI